MLNEIQHSPEILTSLARSREHEYGQMAAGHGSAYGQKVFWVYFKFSIILVRSEESGQFRKMMVFHDLSLIVESKAFHRHSPGPNLTHWRSSTTANGENMWRLAKTAFRTALFAFSKGFLKRKRVDFNRRSLETPLLRKTPKRICYIALEQRQR